MISGLGLLQVFWNFARHCCVLCGRCNVLDLLSDRPELLKNPSWFSAAV
ncbi:hypothetical protein HanPI659440_Chr05g0184791 [Helianthus annuus]|nr:hypothetical protein HanPI659440_Chr05g0184791 [Helianthus annuus]